MKKSTRKVVGIVAALAFVAGACGSDDDRIGHDRGAGRRRNR